MKEIKPPHSIVKNSNKGWYKVFLAGTIEMGNSEDWQTKVSNALSDRPYTILNPRRVDWDSSWSQEFENPQFYQQVTWELNALDKADFIILYLYQIQNHQYHFWNWDYTPIVVNYWFVVQMDSGEKVM